MTVAPRHDATSTAASTATDFMRLLAGKWITAAIATAAKLGVADALSTPQSVDTLAARLDCHHSSLLRLLRVLCSEGLLHESTTGLFSVTPLGAHMQADALKDLAVYVGADFSWSPWAHLDASIRSGTSAFELAKGQSLFAYLESHPQDARVYHRGVDAYTRVQAQALSDVFDFSDYRTVVDVGGGRGTLLIALLERWPHLQGTLFDRPAALRMAEQRPEFVPLLDRTTFYDGDFLQCVDVPADVMLIKHVLHNWDDATALAILERCRAALQPGGAIVVIDGMVLPGNRPDPTRLLDLEMLALCEGGRERTKPEFRRLFHEAGLQLRFSSDLAGTTRLLVGFPK